MASTQHAPTDRRTVDERREELVDAAIDVLTQDGFAKTTTRAVTDRAGLALGAFHYAFRSKDELLDAVAARLGDQLVTVLQDAGVEATGSAVELVDALLTGYWTSVERAPTLHMALHEVVVHALRDPRLRPTAERVQERQIATITELLDSVPDAPSGTDREDLARTVLASLDGLVLQALVERDPAAARRRLTLQSHAFEALCTASAARN